MVWLYIFYMMFRVKVLGHGQPSPIPSNVLDPTASPFIHNHERKHEITQDLDFVGKNHWSYSYMDTCDLREFPLHDDPDMFCTRYVMDYMWVNVEVLATDPILLVFHKFYSEKNAHAFREYINQKEMDLQKVVDQDDPSGAAGHTSRRANGTWMEHYENEITSTLFDFAQRRLPSLNLHGAEQWHALSYQQGGHYAPHHDFLYYTNETQWDWWMNEMGNRLATFLAVLETADEGGGTIFPQLPYVVHPEVGDVMLWLNMDVTDHSIAKSLHGACPILKGQKTAATLWIRIRDSRLSFLTDLTEPQYNLKQLIDPRGVPAIPSQKPKAKQPQE
ncbi:unnamed protein product, partial [Mesorhabditis belari]|uniref:Fe2OG dioxygenase domain-containing protein n=1 Tax=Mesorhabditis belari TaxID=2138241 RepID=A0AAF3EW68_9BILA